MPKAKQDANKSALFKTLESAENLRKCYNNLCKVEADDAERVAKENKQRLMELLGQLTKGTIDKNTYVKELVKAREAMTKSSTTVNLARCSVAKCQKQVREMFTATMETLKHECKGNNMPHGCQIYKQGMALLKAKTIDVDKYLAILHLMLAGNKN